jgi:hypothetical protein
MSATAQQFVSDLSIDSDSDLAEAAAEQGVSEEELESALKEYISEDRDLDADVDTYEACTYTNHTYCSVCSGSACC